MITYTPWFRLCLSLGMLFCHLSLQAADHPDYVRIRKIAYGGSGCPHGSVGESISQDMQAFTLLFDEFVAEAGPGVSRRENRKNCQISVDLDFPPGWSFSIATFDYRGYASLDRRVIGTQVSSYYFQGNPHTGRLSSKLYGPYDDDYHFHDEMEFDEVIWSPCGASRALNINSEVRVRSRNRRATGVMTLDSIDGKVEHRYGLQWKRCRT
ncbi:MAG: DUF4360 domain-containing protein [Zetaproteobacteria bacterium]|nr:DUF4360 domain-containing protein [Zetaproteobacteria bacterium]